MYSNYLVFGFHGCDQEVGERILSSNTKDVGKSENEYDWLGTGAYFWENSPQRALTWAKHVKANPQGFKHKVRKPFVIGAVINLGRCLDLTDTGSLKIIRSGYEALEKTFRTLKIPVPENEPYHDTDADLENSIALSSTSSTT